MPVTRDRYELVAAGQAALRLTHAQFGPLLGSSQRSSERWASRRASPSDAQLEELASQVLGVDPDLAAEIAVVVGKPLYPEGGPPSPARLAEAVLCAAAEVMDASPRALRPALRIAFARARELGLSLEQMEQALAPPEAPKAARPKPR